jgi:asparagine synthase (glutamine-hydrolysing)
MCGFVGVVDTQGVSDAVLNEMTGALSHRGPDDAGLLCFDPATHQFVESTAITENERYSLAIGFRRLSILDTSASGHQPMISPNGRYAITYNGEIYNFQELRTDLLARGYHFRSQTDTEVLLRLYELYGPSMLARLNGMFAFAILDRDNQTAFLARDRMGIKPLYYYARNGCFLFGSEVKSFLYHPVFELALDHRRLSEFFLFRYIAGTDSLLKGVRSLEPGTYMVVGHGQIVSRVYWTIPQHRPELSIFEARTQLTELLENSVSSQLISDVKVGCQLSGGIDSSLVSHWASRHHAGLFDSISVIFEDPRHGEEPYIDHVNRSLGLVGHKATLDVTFMLKHLKRATWHYDFPLSLPNCLGIYLLSQHAREYVTVLLSGEGADEVFGGYRRFYIAAWLSRLRHIPGLVGLSGLEQSMRRFKTIDETLVGLSAFGEPELIHRILSVTKMWSLRSDAVSVNRTWRLGESGAPALISRSAVKIFWPRPKWRGHFLTPLSALFRIATSFALRLFNIAHFEIPYLLIPRKYFQDHPSNPLATGYAEIAQNSFAGALMRGGQRSVRVDVRSPRPGSSGLIPSPIDQNPCAHWRKPMDMMRQG